MGQRVDCSISLQWQEGRAAFLFQLDLSARWTEPLTAKPLGIPPPPHTVVAAARPRIISQRVISRRLRLQESGAWDATARPMSRLPVLHAHAWKCSR